MQPVLLTPSDDESLLERVRERIYQHLCAERTQLTWLIADLLGADLSAAATYGQLCLLGQRLRDAAAAYDSAPIIEAATALEQAAIDAIQKHSDNQSERVWQAIVSLIKLLPIKTRRAIAPRGVGH